MKICPNCHYFGENGQKFCPLCGQVLISKCPKCELPISNPLSRYCTACGYRYEKEVIISEKKHKD